jgi:ElaA protein
MQLHFSCLPFEALTPEELYQILALRQEVFIVEQNCPYLDCDGKDLKSWHLSGKNSEGQLCAYTRLLPLGVSYPEFTSIGRVISASSARGTGAGRAIMQKSIEMTRFLFGNKPIRIGAQKYLLAFYESFGFIADGPDYLEDGIPHIEMFLPAV